MRLKAGENAPHFRIDDLDAGIFDMISARDKPLLLSFFRYASCPLCNLRVHELITKQELFKERLQIVMVFQSPKEKIEQYVGKQDIPYRVLPNPQRHLYVRYGVEASWQAFMKAWVMKLPQVFSALLKHGYRPGSVEGEMHRVPADFVIAPDGVILRAFYGVDIGDHLPIHEIEKVLKAYETG